MRELPILLGAPMVRAILDGRKTVTRRLVKPQLDPGWAFEEPPVFGRIISPHPKRGRFGVFVRHGLGTDFPMTDLIPCPYGQPGDRLWVRETHALEHDVDGGVPPHADGRPVLRRPDDDVDGILPLWTQPHYRATDPAPDLTCERPGCAQCRDHDMGPHWRPAIHMPRWASRITLEMTAVRVERLQDISEAQAVREGLIQLPASGRFVVNAGEQYFGGASRDPREVFSWLWDGLAKPGTTWADNPWVWVVEFRRVEGGTA